MEKKGDPITGSFELAIHSPRVLRVELMPCRVAGAQFIVSVVFADKLQDLVHAGSRIANERCASISTDWWPSPDRRNQFWSAGIETMLVGPDMTPLRVIERHAAVHELLTLPDP